MTTTETMSAPATIARGMTREEISAVLRLSAEYSSVRLFIGVSASRLFKKPELAEVGPNYQRRLTPLGLAVRDALLAAPGGGSAKDG